MWSQQLEKVKAERARHFISIYYLAMEASRGADPVGAKNYETLLEPFGGRDSALGKPFSDGLVFRQEGDSFVLEEPKARCVSLFRPDRLVATDRRWPRWEASGEPARK